MLTRRAAIAATLMMVLGIAVAGAGPASAATRKITLGVVMRDTSIQTYDAFRATMGRAPRLWGMQRPWMGPNNRLPDISELRHLKRNGTTPVLWWLPVDPKHQDVMFRYSWILRGDFDEYIRQFATDAKRFGGRIIIRLSQEMDGDWFAWRVRYPNTKTQFIKAWRHVVKLFRQVGATNVKWLWSPIGPCPKCPNWPSMKSLYPGDAYVDYVGMSAFNWGVPRGEWELANRPWAKWKSMVKAIGPGYAALRAAAPRKPIFIAELGSSSDAPRGTSKAVWIREGYPATYRAYPRIKAIMYFNVDMRGNEREAHENWSLTSPNTTPQSAYRRVMRDSRFQGRI